MRHRVRRQSKKKQIFPIILTLFNRIHRAIRFYSKDSRNSWTNKKSKFRSSGSPWNTQPTNHLPQSMRPSNTWWSGKKHRPNKLKRWQKCGKCRSRLETSIQIHVCSYFCHFSGSDDLQKLSQSNQSQRSLKKSVVFSPFLIFHGLVQTKDLLLATLLIFWNWPTSRAACRHCKCSSWVFSGYAKIN